MDTHAEVLPHEGEERVIRLVNARRRCEDCDEPAVYKHTFLLPNARRNASSSAYGRDDCSYCEDACRFVCEAHKGNRHLPPFEWCSTFTASPRFAHLFLSWEEQEAL